MRHRAVKAVLRVMLALLICAPLGQWAAARQLGVHTPGISTAASAASAIIHARHHARRRFLSLRQAKTQADAVSAPSLQPFIAVLRVLSRGRRSSSFVPPPEHPPA